MAVNVEKCSKCPARNPCIIACEPGSILCIRGIVYGVEKRTVTKYKKRIYDIVRIAEGR